MSKNDYIQELMVDMSYYIFTILLECGTKAVSMSNRCVKGEGVGRHTSGNVGDPFVD